MAGLVVLATLLTAGALAKRINDAQLHEQAGATKHDLVPGPVQSFGLPALATMAGPRAQLDVSPRFNHAEGEGRLRAYASPLMLLGDQQEVGKTPLSRREVGVLLGTLVGGELGSVGRPAHAASGLKTDGLQSACREGYNQEQRRPQSDKKFDELSDLSCIARMKFKRPSKEQTQKVRAAFDTFDKEASGFIAGRDVTKALRRLDLIPERFEQLEFSDSTGKVTDYKDLLLDFITFSGIVLFNSQPSDNSFSSKEDSQKIRIPAVVAPRPLGVGRMKVIPPRGARTDLARAAFDSFDPDFSRVIVGRDLTQALRLLELKPNKFDILEFYDAAGKAADYQDLLLDYKTFQTIIVYNSRIL